MEKYSRNEMINNHKVSRNQEQLNWKNFSMNISRISHSIMVFC